MIIGYFFECFLEFFIGYVGLVNEGLFGFWNGGEVMFLLIFRVVWYIIFCYDWIVFMCVINR